MCHSSFLAQVIGSFMLIVGLAMLVHSARWKKTMHDFLSGPVWIAFSGNISLLLGLLIVLSHNVWVAEWPVVVTLIGWLLLLQGVMRIFFPDSFTKMMKELTARSGYLFLSWGWLIVGAYLAWHGFALN